MVHRDKYVNRCANSTRPDKKGGEIQNNNYKDLYEQGF